MSISIKLDPDIVTPVYNPAILVLDSTKKTEGSFQFRVDINDEDTGILLSRTKYSANLEGYGVIDLHKHLETQVETEKPFTATTLFQIAPQSFVHYDLDLAEIYTYYWPYESTSGSTGESGKVIFSGLNNTHVFEVDDCVTISSTTVNAYSGNTLITKIIDDKRVQTNIDYEAGTSGDTGSLVLCSKGTSVLTGTTNFSGEKYAFNGVRSFDDFIDWEGTTYVPTGSTSKFMTSVTDNYQMDLQDRCWILIPNLSTNIEYIQIESPNGVFQASNPFVGSTDPTFQPHQKFLLLGVGPYNINNVTSTVSIISGSKPVVRASDVGTTGYSITIFDAGDAKRSETKIFKVRDDGCSKYEIFRFLFLDRFGSYMTASFDRVNRRNVELEKTNYRQNIGAYDPITNTWGYRLDDRGKKRLDTIVRKRYTITSNWVTEERARLIEEMIKSPEVYWVNENNVYRSIDILTTSFEEKLRVNDHIFNYQIDFEISGLDPQQKG